MLLPRGAAAAAAAAGHSARAATGTSSRALLVACQASKSAGGRPSSPGGGSSQSSRPGGSNRASSSWRPPKPGPSSSRRRERSRDEQATSSGSSTSSRPPRQSGPPPPSSSGSSSGGGGSSNNRARSGSSSTDSGFKFAARNSPLPATTQLVVVGAGAAGLTAAYFAAKAGAKVTVLERTREAGKKILMSGGTRCNVLPLEVQLQLDYFTSSSAGALRAVFAGWSLTQCKDWLSNDIGLQLLLEQETSKWFPASNSSREVRDRLVAACEKAGVAICYNASLERITPPASSSSNGADSSSSSSSSGSGSSLWQLGLASGATVAAEQVIFSTGGRSFPAVGTDGTGLSLLEALGHRMVPQYAALTPLKGRHPGQQQLAGLTLSDVRLSATKPGSSSSSSSSSSKIAAVAQRGGLLFTHKGYSGPAVLDLSHWLVRPLDEQKQQQQQQQQQPSPQQANAAVPRLLVDWSGEGPEGWQQRLATAGGATTVESLLRKAGIKERLAAALAAEVGVAGKQLSQLKKGEREQLLAAVTAWPLPISGHEGYGKAEVTGGGVALEEIDCRTMQSRVCAGLYLCGEVLDVFGRIGGFNFYWAWLTGKVAGQAAAASAASSQPASSRSSGRGGLTGTDVLRV